MGGEYIPDTTVNLKESFSESTAQTPLILTHSYGELGRDGTLPHSPGIS
jgi:hypothetical protein